MDKIDNLLCITSCDSLQIHEKTLIGQQHYFLCRFTIDLLNNLIYVLYMYKVYLFILQVIKKRICISNCVKTPNYMYISRRRLSRTLLTYCHVYLSIKKYKASRSPLETPAKTWQIVKKSQKQSLSECNAGIHTAQIPLDTNSRQVVSVCIFF